MLAANNKASKRVQTASGRQTNQVRELPDNKHRAGATTVLLRVVIVFPFQEFERRFPPDANNYIRQVAQSRGSVRSKTNSDIWILNDPVQSQDRAAQSTADGSLRGRHSVPAEGRSELKQHGTTSRLFWSGCFAALRYLRRPAGMLRSPPGRVIPRCGRPRYRYLRLLRLKTVFMQGSNRQRYYRSLRCIRYCRFCHVGRHSYGKCSRLFQKSIYLFFEAIYVPLSNVFACLPLMSSLGHFCD